MEESRISLRTGLVYKITCQFCHKHYIGSTIRVLHDRLREHTRDDKYAVYRHIQECRHGIRTEQNIDLTVRMIGQDKQYQPSFQRIYFNAATKIATQRQSGIDGE
jgi:hypothetical protein